MRWQKNSRNNELPFTELSGVRPGKGAVGQDSTANDYSTDTF